MAYRVGGGRGPIFHCPGSGLWAAQLVDLKICCLGPEGLLGECLC